VSDGEKANAGKLQFPCQIGIKAMGRQSEGFSRTVKELVAMHVEADAIIEIRIRSSRAGKYIAVTCEVRLEDRDQMEAIYAAMFDHPDILMTL
jgi:putative lipoic acid-binding regulatory protein